MCYSGHMTDTSPTPQDARAALDEANSRAATVRRADSQLRLILWILAALYLATGALLSGNPRQGSVLIGDALIVIFLAGLAGTVYVMWRIRAWSRMGIVWLLGSVAVFLLWNGAVIWVSIATGWWGPHQPGIHFGGSVVVAVIPLLVAGWLVGRR
jgi:hypothetical protein